MEFRRIEIKQVVRHQELVTGVDEIHLIFEALQENEIPFKISGLNGGSFDECRVLKLNDDSVKIFAMKPQKVRAVVDFSDIIILEVESNCDFVSEYDGGGRWAFLM